MATPSLERSYRTKPPRELGGERSRIGLDFQDHVALLFCLQMLSEQGLTEVWCETHDDIVLIWQDPETNRETFEFVQVKSNASGKLWSVAELCKVESSDSPLSSLLGKSLTQDDADEETIFRIVTAYPVSPDLKMLTYPRDQLHRRPGSDSYQKLLQELHKKVSHIISPNGNGVDFWLGRAFWEVYPGAEALRDRNKITLLEFCQANGIDVLADQLDEIHQQLLGFVFEAGKAEYKTDPSKKRIPCEQFRVKALEIVWRVAHPTRGGVDANLVRKFSEANLLMYVDTASYQRFQYRNQRLAPKYMTNEQASHIENEVLAVLHNLRTKLDAGKLEGDEDSIKFHALCIEKLDALAQMFPTEYPSARSFLYGCMYSITARCQHRFLRAGV